MRRIVAAEAANILLSGVAVAEVSTAVSICHLTCELYAVAVPALRPYGE